ncbi:MAG: ATP synthase subunit I [Casimicrobiaceae bacterium]|nr:ATP synthase subunit I [Casimicrobiaceae bacterium]MCX8099222.1 ATP synthase subunit I [Casimicrobiaceae bacterium]MDW8313069.1 ATP synthase subunit I [Burkholderiales bacterium]
MTGNDINLRNPVLRRMLVIQAGLTVAMAVAAGVMAGEHGMVSALLGGLTNVFASVVYVVVANFGLKHARGTGLWPLLRAEIVKLVFIAVQLAVIVGFYKQLNVGAMFVTFLVTLLAWRAALVIGAGRASGDRRI